MPGKPVLHCDVHMLPIHLPCKKVIHALWTILVVHMLVPNQPGILCTQTRMHTHTGTYTHTLPCVLTRASSWTLGNYSVGYLGMFVGLWSIIISIDLYFYFLTVLTACIAEPVPSMECMSERLHASLSLPIHTVIPMVRRLLTSSCLWL